MNTKRIGKSRKIRRIPRGLENKRKIRIPRVLKVKENKNTKRIEMSGEKEYQEEWKIKENKNTKRIGTLWEKRIPRGLERQEK
jgi:hypothetical protein